MLIPIIISVVTLGLTPVYVLAQKDGANPKSLTLKMICACGYLAMFFVATNGRETDTFSKLMLGAMLASFAGDLFLHLWKPKWIKALGFLGFLSAHFFFIAAFHSKALELNPDEKFFSIPQIIFVVCFAVFFVIFSQKTGMSLKGAMMIPIVVYAVVITTMLSKAVSLSLAYMGSAEATGFILPVILCLGAVNFVASDFTISILMFNKKHAKNIPLKMFNMITYFIAELLLAALPFTI